MPYRRRPTRRRRRYRRRPFSRRRRFAAARGIMFARRRRASGALARITRRRMPTIFPDNANVVFKWRTTWNRTIGSTDPASVGLARYTFLLNGPSKVVEFSQDTQLLDLQPNGWETYEALYNNYICYRSDISLLITTSSNGYAVQATLGPDGNTNPSLVTAEIPYYKQKIIPGDRGRPQTWLKNSARVSKLAGLRLFNEPNYWGSMTAGPSSLPAEKFYWQIEFRPLDPQNQTANARPMQVTIMATIYYHVRFIRRRLDFDDVGGTGASFVRRAAAPPPPDPEEKMDFEDLEI